MQEATQAKIEDLPSVLTQFEKHSNLSTLQTLLSSEILGLNKGRALTLTKTGKYKRTKGQPSKALRDRALLNDVGPSLASQANSLNQFLRSQQLAKPKKNKWKR